MSPIGVYERTLRPPKERLLAKVTVSEDGCWLWTGYVRKDGYANFRIGKRTVLAHRAAYEIFVGPIPEAAELDHLCRVHRCVNPDHLEPVSKLVNQLRGDTFVASNAAKTHCKSGHPFDEANTSRDYKGRRRCRTCDRATWSRYRARRRSARWLRDYGEAS